MKPIFAGNKCFTLEEFENLEELEIAGELNLSHLKITKLPKKLKVGGSLNLSYSSIEILPDNLFVGITLDLTGTPVTKLPHNLKVGWALFLFDTKIDFLPNDLDVDFNIYTSDPDNIKGNLISYRGTDFVKLYKDNSIKFMLSLLEEVKADTPSLV